MKMIETLISVPILGSFAAGANVVSELEAAPAIVANGVSGVSTGYPLIGLGLISALLISGLYMVAREMHREMLDHQDRRER